MNIFIVTVFILITIVVSGCDIERSDKQVNESAQKENKIQLKGKEEVKKPTIVYQRVKKNKPKPARVLSEKMPELLNSAPVEPVLDLSISAEFTQEIKLDKATSYQLQSYLPDLFAKRNKQKKRSIQVEGKLIESKEEEAEKQRTVDGVGIAIKLTQ